MCYLYACGEESCDCPIFNCSVCGIPSSEEVLFGENDGLIICEQCNTFPDEEE